MTDTANPIPIKSLMSWLETQPGGQEYDYFDCSHCALSQFGQSLGMKLEDYEDGGAFYRAVGRRFDRDEYWGVVEIVQDEPWTFGAALSRASNLLSERNR